MDEQNWLTLIKDEGYEAAFQRAHAEATQIAVYAEEADAWAEDAASQLLRMLDLFGPEACCKRNNRHKDCHYTG